MSKLHAVILYLRPDADFLTRSRADWSLADEYATLVWNGPGSPPTLAEVVAAEPAASAALQAPVTNEATLRSQAEAALVDLRAYRDLASPTNAQTVAAVKLLCRVAIGLIRLYLRRFDGTS